MTSVKSKFEYCFSQKNYAFSFDCAGEYCSYLDAYPGTTCVKTDTGLSCSNGITCAEPSNYTAQQSLYQTGPKVQRNESVTLADFCDEHTFVSDGTVKGSSSNSQHIDGCQPKAWAVDVVPVVSASSVPTQSQTATGTLQSTPVVSHLVTVTLGGGQTVVLGTPTSAHPSSTTSSSEHTTATTVAGSARRLNVSSSGLLVTLLLFLNLFIGAALAMPSSPQDSLTYPINLDNTVASSTNHTLLPRGGDLEKDVEHLVELLSEYYGGVLKKEAHSKGPLLENGIICEVIGFACDHIAYLALNAAVAGGAKAFIDGCTAFVVELAAVEPPMEILALLGAGTLCNWIFNEFLGAVTEDGLGRVCKPVEERCKELFGEEKATAMFHPVEFIDLMGDAKNCGEVGKFVSLHTLF